MRAIPWVLALFLAGVADAYGNPAARPSRDADALAGHWNGAHLENRSECTTPQNNGFHGTYSDYTIRVVPGSTLVIDEVAVTGLTCNYAGPYQVEGGRLAWSGSLSCTDGRAGTFQSQTLFAQGTALSIRLAIRLHSSERCLIDALLGGARF
jgi:hypothetical protein